uniref:Uncharacterized protein n=1 Tax=Mesocestoides corti TaxID=53468 RepID=A0A5K3FZP7_MESCO
MQSLSSKHAPSSQHTRSREEHHLTPHYRRRVNGISTTCGPSIPTRKRHTTLHEHAADALRRDSIRLDVTRHNHFHTTNSVLYSDGTNENI